MSENPKKKGAPPKPEGERHTARLYVYVRPKDKTDELRAMLQRARDAYEKKADAPTTR